MEVGEEGGYCNSLLINMALKHPQKPEVLLGTGRSGGGGGGGV